MCTFLQAQPDAPVIDAVSDSPRPNDTSIVQAYRPVSFPLTVVGASELMQAILGPCCNPAVARADPDLYHLVNTERSIDMECTQIAAYSYPIVRDGIAASTAFICLVAGFLADIRRFTHHF